MDLARELIKGNEGIGRVQRKNGGNQRIAVPERLQRSSGRDLVGCHRDRGEVRYRGQPEPDIGRVLGVIEGKFEEGGGVGDAPERAGPRAGIEIRYSVPTT